MTTKTPTPLKRMTVLLSEEEEKHIAEIYNETRIPKSTVVRMFIQYCINKNVQPGCVE